MVSGVDVRDVMGTEPVTAPPDAAFKDLVGLVVERDADAIVIVAPDGAPEGIVTASDLLAVPGSDSGASSLRARARGALGRSLPDPRRARVTARDVMSQPVVTISSTAPLFTAARLMVDQRVGHLPVVDDDRFVGIISRRDVVSSYHRPDDEIAAEVVAVLDDPAFLEGGHRIQVSVADGCVTLTGTVDVPSNVVVLTPTVGRVGGVVDVDNRVTAKLPEPRPQTTVVPDPPYGLPR